MKAKFKKILPLISIVTVAAPLVAVVSCNGTKDLRKDVPADDAVLYSGPDGKDVKVSELVEEVKKNEITPTTTNLINEVKSLAAEKYYDIEQKASIELQVEDLKYQIYQDVDSQFETAKIIFANLKAETGWTNNKWDDKYNNNVDWGIVYESPEYLEKKTFIGEAQKVADAAKNKQTDKTDYATWAKSISDKNDAIKDVQDKLNKIADDKGNAKSSDQIDYNESNFKSNFPKILDKLDNIKTAQTKVYNDAKAAFIDIAQTKPEGEAGWTAQLGQKYGGAKNDDEAIRYLVKNTISTAAFGKYTYTVNSSFIVKQVKSGIYKQFVGKYGANNDFKGGIVTAHIDEDNGKTLPDNTSKVYFIARGTNEVSNIVVDPKSGEMKDALDLFASKGAILVQHALMKITAGTDSTLPWTISKADFKNLFAYYTNTEQAFDLWQNIYKKISGSQTQSQKDIEDTAFLTHFSNNEDTTKQTLGTLGVYTIADLVTQMDPGFGLGVVAAMAQKNTAVTTLKQNMGFSTSGADVLNKIKSDINTAIVNAKIPGWSSLTTAPEKNNAISAYIDTLSDTDFNTTYGAIFRNSIAEKEAVVYKLTTDASDDRYLVISSFGFHIIKISELADSTALSNSIFDDLNRMAKDDNVSSAHVDWSTTFGKMFDDNAIVQQVLKDDNIAKVELGLNDFKTKNASLFNEWVSNKYLSDSETDVIKKVQTILDNIKNNAVVTSATSALNGNGNVSWLITKIDGKFLDGAVSADPNTTLDPDKFYDAELKILGVK